MSNHSKLARTAALIGDLARASMLTALMDGRALTATELARVANITPQTASGHLARLAEAGLVVVERQGRHRYHRLASPVVARMVEGMMAVATELEDRVAVERPTPVRVGPRDAALRYARTCYDHLAGEIAVAMADRLVARGHVELSADGGVLTPEGAAFLRGLGVDVDAATAHAGRKASGRVFCRPCLDWSERRPHIGGALGAALCHCCFTQGWMRRAAGGRVVTVTPPGQLALREAFGLD
jgi:DNA-binding transcriptional ArsR family regulator